MPRPPRPARARPDQKAGAQPGRPSRKARPNRPLDARPRGVTIRAEAGMPLMRWVALQSGETLSVREAKRLLEQGICRINGRVETFGSRVLVAGDVVELALPERAPKASFALERERFVHVDDAMLVYDKPPGLPVTPADGKKGPDLQTLVQAAYPEARAVHRIDADTTGLVVFARTTEVKKLLEEAFRDHRVDKAYLALVRGQPRPEGTHKSFLVKLEAGQGFETWASGRGEGAKEAITSWRVIEKLGAWASLVEVRPETGRHHQIRIHMKELGHPLIGDTRYGDRRDPVPAGLIPRHMLHASQIMLDHPTTGKRLVLRARPPLDFLAAEEILRKAK
ncbi:MAG: RluA family pseudouridine synthase [Deltaproteobacteria bacterium]|nr:RluA family pseudouridine synthase [Deltaproteobacteria bacterium]